MAKKYFCKYPGYIVMFRYEGMTREKQYDYPIEKRIEMRITLLDEVEGDNKKRVRLGYVDENPRANDRTLKGGARESSPAYQVPITPKTLQWLTTPEQDCPDIVTAFLMSVKPTDRIKKLDVTEEDGFLCSINRQVTDDITCMDVPDGTPDSFTDGVEIPKSLLETKEIRISDKAKVAEKKKSKVTA